mmetsp:Transcript_26108/g.31602  ORF Transcript_26108/g.31602 Transcript_26108/m.31602 type:complete len:250 (-) Transcript_26108:37-786(-)|eukprot:CAMPEP_0172495984 /NCGR_PEP_ID=MMETSP1066-20121228/79773_1 /TAXON_ID=671091 /ORGANISM="Coscinodiscus wailesii, Strain CCMP2513" /LENGTH=249 /DNA_ID=CAMNT_0013268021 /DNA_START=44 /DNA_END=793 /DNA_ORIENTATION=+
MTTPQISQQHTLSSVESRLSSIERLLGIETLATSSPQQQHDIDSRLSSLLLLLSNNTNISNTPSSSTTSATVSAATIKNLNDELAECDKLEDELNPGSILSHQVACSAPGSTFGVPLLYRRQEVLSSADAIKTYSKQLSQIRDLLLISSPTQPQPNSTTTSSITRNDDNRDYTKAPIVSSEWYEYANDATAQKRLHDVASRAESLKGRTEGMAVRVDALLNCYHRVVAAVSEKMVLVDEELNVFEGERV